jgi:4-hydroxy-4-methyl-2-oxoglutarate aldolase
MGDKRIYERIPEVDPAAIEALRGFGSSDVHEALGPDRGVRALMGTEMRALNRGVRAVGQAMTAEDAPGNNLMMHAALRLAGPGQILVLTCGGGSGARGALWGELAARVATRNGVAGVIVDGNIRDTAELVAMDFPIWSTAISPLRSDKREGGCVNMPVICAGVRVDPGDLIVADADGVVVVRPDEVAAVVAAAGRRKAREAAFRDGIARGDALFDLLGLATALDAAGVERRPGSWWEDGAAS